MNISLETNVSLSAYTKIIAKQRKTETSPELLLSGITFDSGQYKLTNVMVNYIIMLFQHFVRFTPWNIYLLQVIAQYWLHTNCSLLFWKGQFSILTSNKFLAIILDRSKINQDSSFTILQDNNIFTTLSFVQNYTAN